MAVSRSQAASAPAGVRVADVVPNPIVVDRWPLVLDKQEYLLWVGRMDPVKGAHRAIEAARIAGRSLVLAGPVQTGQEEYFRELVKPHIDGRRVRYVGELGGTAIQELFANAAALLMPIRWREPFGMVMIEALACGTPVIAFPEGAAAEIVIDGENGMLVADEAEMAGAVERIGSIDPKRCRASVAERYDISVTVAGYEHVYRRAIAADCPRHPQRATGTASNGVPLPTATAQCELMANSATPTSTDHVQPYSEGDRELARALALLQDDRAGSVTIAALRERGIKAPAQAVYDLQLLGHAIDRVSCTDPDGHRTFGYRLHGSPWGDAEPLAGLREADGDGACRGRQPVPSCDVVWGWPRLPRHGVAVRAACARSAIRSCSSVLFVVLPAGRLRSTSRLPLG